MSRNQRKLLFAVATSTLVIGLQSFAVAELKCFPNCGAQQQQTERWKIIGFVGPVLPVGPFL